MPCPCSPGISATKLNKQANDILATIPADTENQTLIHYRGQALVARAFANFTLAQRFQFTYKGNEDKPTVPIVTWDMPAERAVPTRVPPMPKSTRSSTTT